MITNKSTTIRVGSSTNWSIGFTSQDYLSYNTYSAVQDFLCSFFLDSGFRNRGTVFSHTLLRSTVRKLEIHNFVQDAKIVDFVNTFPRRSLFSQIIRSNLRFGRIGGRNRYARFNKHLRRQYAMAKFKKFFFKKKNLFFVARSYRFSTKAPLVQQKVFRLFGNYLLSKRFALFSRIKRSKRYRSYAQTYFINFINFFSAHRSFRLRYYYFVSRLLAYFFYFSTGFPLHVNINHLLTRHATANFYLNYICTKLYYRYILNDVVNPIVRMSLRYYRGFFLNCKGRFTRAQMASQKNYRRGAMAFSTISNPVDYAQKSVVLKYGTCNLKLWIRR